MSQPAVTISERVCDLMDRALFKEGNNYLMSMSAEKLAAKLREFDPFLEYVPTSVVVSACRDYLDGN